MSHAARRPFRQEWVLYLGILSLITLAGAILRFAALGQHPYGLYQDEAINGLDALGVLDGVRPLYFPANNGREPIYIYLMALAIRLWGRTPLAVRLSSAVLGVLTIPATYALGRAWFNRRVGLLAAAVLAGLLWHVHLSRVGFRAVALPMFAALALAVGAAALRKRSRRLLLATGALYGLLFYTYLPARFTPLACGLMLLYAFVWHREALAAHWRDLLWMALGAAVTLAPFGWLLITQPEVVLGRSGQVAIWNPAVHRGDPVGALFHSTLRALAMFTWRGDAIWRHNVPGRPVFDPLIGAAFLAGLLLAVARWRRQPGAAVSVLWCGVLILPTLLAEDAPHFLRGAGVLPVIVLLPALALDAGAEWLAGRGLSEPVIAAGLGFALALSGGLTTRDYFGCRPDGLRFSGFDYVGCYQDDPVRGYFFQSAATDLANAANATAGTLYLDRRFWDTFPSVRFLLVAGDDRLHLYREGETLPQGQPPLALFAWPHGPLEPALNALPEDAAIRVIPGPETRGDLEPEPYRLYVQYVAALPGEHLEPVARFANGMVLLAMRVQPGEASLSIELSWQADAAPGADVRFFVHLLGPDGRAILAQYDGPPGTVYYPALSWRPGDVIIEQFSVAYTASDEHAQPGLRLGLYDPRSGDRVTVEQAEVPVYDNALQFAPDR